VAGLLTAAGALALPATAHASLLSPAAEDALATYIAIFALFFVPIVLIVLFWIVHVMPEKIAHKKHHPQFEAIRTLCLLGCAFGLQGIAGAFNVQDPSTDFAFLEFEPYPTIGGSRFQGPAVAPSRVDRAWRMAGQLAFPAGKIASRADTCRMAILCSWTAARPSLNPLVLSTLNTEWSAGRRRSASIRSTFR